MATVKNASRTFTNQPLIQLVGLYEASSTAAGTVVEMVEVKSGFRVTRVYFAFDDLGTSTTATVGDGGSATRFLGSTDTATSASTATYTPAADSKGYLYTADDTVDITFGGSNASTGSVKLVVEGWFDFE